MNETDAIAYLTRCSDDNGEHWSGGLEYPASDCRTCNGTDDAGHLGTPGSRYGSTSARCAPTAYRFACVEIANEYGARRWHADPSAADLDYVMSLVVNDSDAPEEALRDYAIGHAHGVDVDDMVRGYLDAQLWAQLDMERLDDNGNAPTLDENYDRDDIADEYVDAVREMFAELVSEHPLAVRMYAAQRKYSYLDGSASDHFGHDFYLTREHHGAGFWDRGLGDLGRYLTDIAHAAGSADDLWDNGSGTLAA